MVKYLVENGANIKAKDYDGRTAIHYTSWQGDCVHCLFETKIHKKFKNYLELGHLDVAKYLVQSGADLGALDNYGQTAKDLASDYGNWNF